MSAPLIPTLKSAVTGEWRENFDRVVSRLRSQHNDDRARLALYALSQGPTLVGTVMTPRIVIYANGRD
jgi:hypothetical protein